MKQDDTNRLLNLIDSEVFMIEGHYISLSDIYKLPIMDFSVYYSKIKSNINERIKNYNDKMKKHK